MSAPVGGQHGGVSGLLWDEVRNLFDPDVVGALPDVRVDDASVGDWQAVLDLVKACGWRYEYREGEAVVPLPSAEQVLSRPADAEFPSLRVRPVPEVLAIFWFLSDSVIDFDVDLRELQGQERLDILCGFFATIGRRLGKPVLMSTEGGAHALLGFDVQADRVVPAEPEAGRPR